MLTLPTTLRFTAGQFAEVCADNPEAMLGPKVNCRLVEMTPAGSVTRSRSQALRALLWTAVRHGAYP